MVYLDHAATTPVPRAVADVMYAVLTEQFGNPSAQYPMGLEMKRRVEAWRATVAQAVGCEPGRLFFTSCGTDGDNWALRAALLAQPRVGRHIVTTGRRAPCRAELLPPVRAGGLGGHPPSAGRKWRHFRRGRALGSAARTRRWCPL